MLCTGQYNSATIAGPAPFIWRRVLSSWARELGRSGQWYVFGGNFIQKKLKFTKSCLTKDISKISTSSGLRPVPTGLAFAAMAACAEGSGSCALRTSGYMALDFVSLGTGIGSVGSVVCFWWQLHPKKTEIYKILSYKGHIKDLNVFWIEACPNRSCLCSDCSLCRMIWFVRSSNLRIYGIGFCLVGHGNWVGRVSGMFLVATSSKKSLKFIKSYLTKDISKISTSSGLRPIPTVLPLQGWQLVQKDLVRALLEPPDIWRWILSRWAR